MLNTKEIISQLESLREYSRREKNGPGDIWDKDCEALDYAIQAVIEKQERRWIPVSERLPEKPGVYLATGVRYFEVEVLSLLLDNDNIWRIDEEENFTFNGKVFAWQPMPEPWEDVAPVVRGRWIDDPVAGPICSACGDRVWKWTKGQKSPCCPFCGARMDGEEKQ